jgi:hypothetical protein
MMKSLSMPSWLKKRRLVTETLVWNWNFYLIGGTFGCNARMH